MPRNVNIRAATITGGIAIGDKPTAYGQGYFVNNVNNSAAPEEPAKATQRPFRFLAVTVWTICLGSVGSIIAAIIYPGTVNYLLHW